MYLYFDLYLPSDFFLQRLMFQSGMPYLGVGIMLWLCLLQGGINADIAGVLAAVSVAVGCCSGLLQCVAETCNADVAGGLDAVRVAVCCCSVLLQCVVAVCCCSMLQWIAESCKLMSPVFWLW